MARPSGQDGTFLGRGQRRQARRRVRGDGLEYDADDLLRDARRMFPDRPYHAVCFGQPTPAGDTDATNAYAAEAGRREVSTRCGSRAAT